VFEGAMSAWMFKREPEREMLAGLGKAIIPLIAAYLALRLADLAVRGQIGTLFAFDFYTVMSLIEVALFIAAIVLLPNDAPRRRLGALFRAARLLMLAGSVYRFDTYLVAFRPGAQWSYFPSVTEMLITFGLVSGEILVYIVIVKLFPITTMEKHSWRESPSTL